jgi:hypothetical protein
LWEWRSGLVGVRVGFKLAPTEPVGAAPATGKAKHDKSAGLKTAATTAAAVVVTSASKSSVR